jgi:anti-sigma regulatory factor (Ser/Thr protein kinase)
MGVGRPDLEGGAMRTVGLLGVVDLPGAVTSVSVARAYVRELLRESGHPELERVELLVSELVANAVQHSNSGRRAHGVVRLVVADNGHTLHVDVIDEGSASAIPEIPRKVDPLNESGRGLWLVRELSSAWGWEEGQAGRIVWFEVTR